MILTFPQPPISCATEETSHETMKKKTVDFVIVILVRLTGYLNRLLLNSKGLVTV